MISLIVAELRQFVLGDKAFFYRRPLQFFGIQPAAVIADFNDDPVSGMPGFERDAAVFTFARTRALLRRFDTVIHTIANHLREGIYNQLSDRAVYFRLLTANLKLNLFAEFLRQFESDSREPVEYPIKR